MFPIACFLSFFVDGCSIHAGTTGDGGVCQPACLDDERCVAGTCQPIGLPASDAATRDSAVAPADSSPAQDAVSEIPPPAFVQAGHGDNSGQRGNPSATLSLAQAPIPENLLVLIAVSRTANANGQDFTWPTGFVQIAKSTAGTPDGNGEIHVAMAARKAPGDAPKQYSVVVANRDTNPDLSVISYAAEIWMGEYSGVPTAIPDSFITVNDNNTNVSSTIAVGDVTPVAPRNLTLVADVLRHSPDDGVPSYTQDVASRFHAASFATSLSGVNFNVGEEVTLNSVAPQNTVVDTHFADYQAALMATWSGQ